MRVDDAHRIGRPRRPFQEAPGPGGQVCHGKCEPVHSRSNTVGPGRPGTRKGHDKEAQMSLRAVRERIGLFDGDKNSLRPLPRNVYKDLISALPHCSTCCTPAPSNLFTWVSLPPPLPSSLPSQPSRPGRCRDSCQIRASRPDPILSESRSEPKESIRVSRPDLSQPARSDPRRDPSPKGRSESASLIRAVRHDPSRFPSSSSSSRTFQP
jgi:hypothetical protein